MSRKSHRSPIQIVSVILFALAGCSLQNSSLPDPSAHVYIAGYYNQYSAATACYWLDGNRTALASGGLYPAYTTSIFVSDGTVYVAGQYYNQTSGYIGCY